jgi:hypothetical protein
VVKVSRTQRTIANVVRDRVLARFPELATGSDIPGVWFTGSHVWTALVGEAAPEGEDWDVFVVPAGVWHGWRDVGGVELPTEYTTDAEGVRRALCDRLGLLDFPQLHTYQKHEGSSPPEDASDGVCYRTPRGEVDVWTAPYGDARSALREYRTETHSHCRAAFSLVDGLVALPNENAPRRGGPCLALAVRGPTALVLHRAPELDVDAAPGRALLVRAAAWLILLGLLASAIAAVLP